MLPHTAYPAKDNKSLVVVIGRHGRASSMTQQQWEGLVKLEIKCTEEQYLIGRAHYEQGQMIQDAFNFLTDGEREFLISGLTPEEWDAVFGKMEDEEAA